MSDVDWACVKLETPSGVIYLVSDEDERARFARGGRAVFSRDELAPCLKVLATWSREERQAWLTDMRNVKATFPAARVEPPALRAQE